MRAESVHRLALYRWAMPLLSDSGTPLNAGLSDDNEASALSEARWLEAQLFPPPSSRAPAAACDISRTLL
jgi:hypothetical protein